MNAVVAYGPPSAIAATAEEHRRAGADHVVLTPGTHDHDAAITDLVLVAAIVR